MRVVAGAVGDGVVGPFKTKTSIQILDMQLEKNVVAVQDIAADANNCIVYVAAGGGEINGATVKHRDVLLFDASDIAGARRLRAVAGNDGLSLMVFAGFVRLSCNLLFFVVCVCFFLLL